MRTTILVAAAILALVGCSPKKAEPAAPTPTTPAVAPALPAASESVPIAESSAARPAPQAEAVRWSAADYAKRERRLAALIANAETRDSSGQTQRHTAEGRNRRSRCATKACIEQSYAAEEAWLKQWEGSGDIR